MKKRIFLLLLIVTLLCGCRSAVPQQTAAPAYSFLTVHYLDVGQADAMVLECDGEFAVIDAAYADNTDDILAYMNRLGVEKLKLVVGTHPHEDHVGGLSYIIDAFPTEHFWFSEIPFTNPMLDFLMARLDANQITMEQPKPGHTLQLGSATVTVLGPVRTDYEDVNNISLVLMVEHGENRFLFTGDMAQSGSIVGEYAELCANVDVLKFPHHGDQPYEIGQRASRIVRPQHLLVPGVASEYKLWDFFDNMGVKFSRDHVYTMADGHVVILTDGGERFDVLTQQNPADYAPEAV